MPSALRLLGVNAALAGATLLTSVVLARALAPEGRGILAAFTLWPLVLSHLGMMGVHLHLGRTVGHRRSGVRAHYRHGYVIVAATTMIAAVSWMAIDALTPNWPAVATPHLELTFLLLSAAIIPFSSWNALQVQMELGRGALATYNFARASFTLFHLAAVVIVWLTQQSAPVAYLMCFVGAAAAASILSGTVIASSLSADENPREEDVPVLACADTLRASWPFAVSTAAVALMTMADRILISVFFDAKTLGLYVVAIAMTQLQNVVNEAMAPLFFSRLAQRASLQAADSEWLCRRLRQSLVINTIIAAGLLAIAPVLLPLVFGRAYEPALMFVSLLAPAIALRAAVRPFEEVLKALNKPISQVTIILTMSAVFAAGGCVAAFLSSAVGVVVALLIAHAIGLALAAVRLRQQTGLAITQVLVPRWRDLVDLSCEIARIARG